jgi:hypothetical protein
MRIQKHGRHCQDGLVLLPETFSAYLVDELYVVGNSMKAAETLTDIGAIDVDRISASWSTRGLLEGCMSMSAHSMPKSSSSTSSSSPILTLARLERVAELEGPAI